MWQKVVWIALKDAFIDILFHVAEMYSDGSLLMKRSGQSPGSWTNNARDHIAIVPCVWCKYAFHAGSGSAVL